MKIERLEPFIQNYAWGHMSWLQEFMNHPEAVGKEPWAEMWLGAHPKGMTQVSYTDGTKEAMDSLIAGNREAVLGSAEAQLPFLYKILAIAQPLSIQCHPSKAQAVEGFARENSAGVALSAPNRNFKDDNHKPEILCALTPFIAMCGFRSRESIIELFSQVIPTAYEQYFSSLISDAADEDALYRGVLTKVLSLAGDERASFMAAVRADLEGNSSDSIEVMLVKRFLGLYPNDPAVLAPLYLNVLELAPGEALYQPAGEMHAYVEGIGVELMANSDNVLRGGLTPKHIDVKELMDVVIFKHIDKQKTLPTTVQNGSLLYETPSDEFVLQVVDHAVCEFSDHGCIEMVIQAEGSSVITYGEGERVEIEAGSSCLIPASVSSYTIACEGRLFLAGIPE